MDDQNLQTPAAEPVEVPVEPATEAPVTETPATEAPATETPETPAQ
jgi:preprotein translocase subunit SecG